LIRALPNRASIRGLSLVVVLYGWYIPEMKFSGGACADQIHPLSSTERLLHARTFETVPEGPRTSGRECNTRCNTHHALSAAAPLRRHMCWPQAAILTSVSYQERTRRFPGPRSIRVHDAKAVRWPSDPIRFSCLFWRTHLAFWQRWY
jgi:hypothetical protein